MKGNLMQVDLTLESKGHVHMYSQGSIRLKQFYFIFCLVDTFGNCS